VTGLCPVCFDCFCDDDEVVVVVSFGELSVDLVDLVGRSRGDALLVDFLCFFNSGPALGVEGFVDETEAADLERFGAGNMGVFA